MLIVYKPAHGSVRELQDGTEQAWRHAYSWSSIARRLWASPASRSVALLANLGYRYYAHHLQQFYNCDWIIGSQGPPTAQLSEGSAWARETDESVPEPLTGRP